MDPDTFRNDIGVDVYWRRRMAALVGVLVVVAVVAWACSSTSGPENASEESASGARSATPDPLPAILSTVTISPSPSPTPSPTSKSERAQEISRQKRPGDVCDSPDLVLNMADQGEVYAPGSQPRFVLTLVNIGDEMCTVDVGPRGMEVRITSGNDRVWSSADCVGGEIDNIRKLERGIPYVREVEWDRRRSGTDCKADQVVARPGTYVAVARAPGLRSPKTVFHLR
ncbi:hypothetical protein SAMN05216276_10302 [Streptosporangium subroseum]|uniref:Uncharacterized protein n=1 Tax=Streptosporangium subroseum TaxID=106412 RepID=A0A239L1D2_9ACTN|nr:hypothetical protein [Streptosporangium subroseum]SNT23802.1 hypothetical protein SAMN05216276_10302 [Streptosporangium subroseum]